MSNIPASLPTVPTITGNPGIDSLIRSALIAAAAALTGVMLTWLNAHGFNDPNLNLLLSGAVLTVLTTAAVALWGYLKGTQIGRVVSDAHLVGVQAGVVLQQKAIAFAGPATSSEAAAIDPEQLTHDDAKAAIAALPPSSPKA